MFRLLPVVLVLVFFVGCSGPEENARAHLRKVDAQQLRFEAARLYNQLWNSPGVEFLPVKPSFWPPTFQQLAPKRVAAYADGFALVFSESGASEAGLHVQPLGMDKWPSGTFRRYERLEEGIFWFGAK